MVPEALDILPELELNEAALEQLNISSDPYHKHALHTGEEVVELLQRKEPLTANADRQQGAVHGSSQGIGICSSEWLQVQHVEDLCELLELPFSPGSDVEEGSADEIEGTGGNGNKGLESMQSMCAADVDLQHLDVDTCPPLLMQEEAAILRGLYDHGLFEDGKDLLPPKNNIPPYFETKYPGQFHQLLNFWRLQLEACIMKVEERMEQLTMIEPILKAQMMLQRQYMLLQIEGKHTGICSKAEELHMGKEIAQMEELTKIAAEQLHGWFHDED
ncbi:hypothetical protein WOLCODRAFT_20967 [Wolfiporia cocos MD-104 SS10]|uniref:Uncharacterized protein n=1 Tax=Wolfiporia cocos (strain MD-104) TaxID=742152 RepID=A0A2H3JKJ2_WOLCO|nr:hypothetical protein WOLCODRAFT_20967 [Wolfiporia cocos MD-104 SS10]